MVSGRTVITLLLAVVMLAAVQAIVPSMAVTAAPNDAAQIADGGLLKSSGVFTLADGQSTYLRLTPGPFGYTAEYTGVGELVLITYTDELSNVITISMTAVTLFTVPEQVSFYSPAADVGDFGSVQFQVAAEVSDTIAVVQRVDVVGGEGLPNDFPVWLTTGVIIAWTPQFAHRPSNGTCAAATDWADAQTYHVYDYPEWSETPGRAWVEPVTFSAKTSGTQPMGFEVTTRGPCVRLRYEIDTPERLFSPRIWARAINRK